MVNRNGTTYTASLGRAEQTNLKQVNINKSKTGIK